MEGPVVERADGGRRPEKRHDAVADECPEDQEVVALVGVPRPAARQVHEAECGGDSEQDDEAETLPADVLGGRGRAAPCRHRAPQTGSG